MPLDRRDPAHLWDIVEQAKRAVASTNGLTLAEFLANETLLLATERRLEIIGEAARRLSGGFRDEHPEVPWRSVIGLRNVLAHEYDDIEYARLWAVVRDRLPDFARILEPLMPPLPFDRED